MTKINSNAITIITRLFIFLIFLFNHNYLKSTYLFLNNMISIKYFLQKKHFQID